MKKLIAVLVCSALLALNIKIVDKSSDAYLRDRIVKLESEAGSCSGVQVIAPSGKVYILTAAHCRMLIDNQGHTTAVNENGDKRQVDFIAEDDTSDLMLLTSGDTKFTSIAQKTQLHEKVHAITHGRGHVAYRTDGELIEEDLLTIGISMIQTSLDLKNCIKQPKNKALPTLEGMYCAISTNEQYSTVQVVPGSSGGPVFNEKGELVGIVSATDGIFSMFVKLSDIKNFLKDK